MPLLFATTLFVSATLLFTVQPLVGRLLLPALGGSPVVWNTCLVFFQGVLLLGYFYAHATIRWLGVRRQIWLHLALLPLPLMVLPITLTDLPPSGVEAAPVGWLLLTLSVVVGLPVFVVSTTAPLLQRWFAHTDHPSAVDPYYLYAASNLGSMIALLGYPFLVEAHLTLGQQGTWWLAGYGLFAVLVITCGLWARFTSLSSRLNESPNRESLSWQRRLGWAVLAFIPSSLLVGVTTHLTTDLAAIPLLWVVPLGLYLLTFILVFRRGTQVPLTWLSRATAIGLLGLILCLSMRITEPLLLVASIHLVAFFIAAWFCHALLAHDRPLPTRLTEFYLWLSIGGVLGGVFNVLLAPILFRHVGLIEYPLAFLAVSLLRMKILPQRLGWWDAVLPIIVGLTAFALLLATRLEPARSWLDTWASRWAIPDTTLRNGISLGVASLLVYAFVRQPLRFSLGLAAILWAGSLDTTSTGRTIFLERNSLGMVRVTTDESGQVYQLVHGNRVHGQQRRGSSTEDPGLLVYFHPQGPIGSVFETLTHREQGLHAVGVVGLGPGSLAWYAQAGQDWTFFELDPTVIRVAQDPRFFTYLDDCQAESLRILAGDARLRLREIEDATFDLLILDAFSSDAIPIHLVTAEALDLYGSKLKPGGMLAFHITNRYVDLAPILGQLAESAPEPWALRLGEYTEVPETERDQGRTHATWVVMAKREADLERLANSPLWHPLTVPEGTPHWTDDFADLLSALR